MKEFEATVAWRRDNGPFADQRYSRRHEWRFDGGARVPASSSPLSVPVPMSDPAAVDPEEALVAAASSCHMLFFLAFAAQRGFVVDSYTDQAVGYLEKDANGVIAITRIALRPAIVFSLTPPTPAELAAIHHHAHSRCYIANSIKGEIVVEAVA